MTLFRRLTLASVVATFLLVTIGGLVRATKSGLGCGTDWPHCLGRLTPALENRALVIEYSHRAAAGVVVILLAVLALLAMLRHRDKPRVLWSAIGAFGLVLFQAALGAIVVKLELQAVSVVLHLAAALALLALLVYLSAVVYAVDRRLESSTDPAVARRAMSAAAAVLGLLLVGSYLSGVGAAENAGFPEWPLIDGRVVPDLAQQVTALHWLHRVLAVVVAVVVAYAALAVVRRKDELPVAAKFAHAAAGLYVVELLIGATNVWTQSNGAVNSASVTLHLAVGAAIWGCLVAVTVITAPGVRRVAQRRAARPALQGGTT